MKNQKVLAAIMAASMILSGCNSVKDATTDNAAITQEDTTTESDVTKSDTETESIINRSEVFSERDLSGEYDAAECYNITLSDQGSASDAEGVSIDGSKITISKEGDYIFTGTLTDGMVIVEVAEEEKVQLILNGVNINSASSAAIYVKQADKVFVTLAEGTSNTLSNGGTFAVEDDNNVDAVIFSKEDITLNGNGVMSVSSPAGHGIVSKDELTITNGTYDINAASHAIIGKDSVCIADGNFTITAGTDGIHSDNDEDDAKGYIYVKDGKFEINAVSDGMSALNEIYVEDGKMNISKSEEGLEARLIHIAGGEVSIASSDDGLNATDKRDEEESETTDETRKEPENPPANGERPEKPTEMSEDMKMKRPEGNFKEGFREEGFGGGMMDADEAACISISGGIINITAEGDGIDTNGYFKVTGGEIYVMGSSNGGNAAIDYGIDAAITGGIVIAAGQSGMATNFGSDSTQCAMLVNTENIQTAGTDIIVSDSDGANVIAWTTEKSYNSVVISSPDLSVGSTYTVKMGDSNTEVTFEEVIYGNGFGMGGFRGQKFDRESEQNSEGDTNENSVSGR